MARCFVSRLRSSQTLIAPSMFISAAVKPLATDQKAKKKNRDTPRTAQGHGRLTQGNFPDTDSGASLDMEHQLLWC